MTLGLHPESTPDPSVVRWRFSDAPSAPVPGVINPIPDDLARLGAIDVMAEPGAILVRLADGLSWRTQGVLIRTVLSGRLMHGSWAVDTNASPTLGESDDAAIERAARAVIAEEIDVVAGSHGGGVTLVDVKDGVVSVELEGACDGCPAASMTLHRRFETSLRHRVTGVVAVQAVGGSCSASKPKRGLGQFIGWPHDRNRQRNN